MMYVSARNILLPLFQKKIAQVAGVEHLPAHPPYLLAANHIDFLDGFFISAAVHHSERKHSVYFLTKSNNYWWTRVTIPIDPKKRSESMDDAFSHLRRNKVICNFIEGHRNPGSHLLPGKTGTARLALVAHVPVIPVGIRGPCGKNFMHSLANFMTEGRSITIRFGPEIDLDGLRSKPIDYSVLSEATNRIMRSLVPLAGKAFAG